MSNITVQTFSVDIPSAGTIDSSAWSKFSKDAAQDLRDLAKQINLVDGKASDIGDSVFQEMNQLRTAVEAIRKSQYFREKNATDITMTLDFFSRENAEYAPGTIDQNKLILDTTHGQVFLPVVNVTPLMYGEDGVGNIQKLTDIEVTINPSERITGGAYLPEIVTNDVYNAFNGSNSEYWIRKIYYPLEAPISEVTIDVIVTPPAETGRIFNTVQLAPYPLRRCDVMGIWYKQSEGANWSLLEEYPYTVVDGEKVPDVINNSHYLQYIGTERSVYQFKFSLRQRNWIEQNNKKCFIYGAEEFAASLNSFVTYDRMYQYETQKNCNLIYHVTAPEGVAFKTITKIDIDPDCKAEGSNIDDNHVMYQLSRVPNPTSPNDIYWDSITRPLPQDGTAVLMNKNSVDGDTEYYVIISMRYVNSLNPAATTVIPFGVRTTPVLSTVAIKHTIEEVNVEPIVTPVDPEQYYGYNAAVHFTNVMAMDALKGSINTGANSLIFWDDFWSGPESDTWRSGLVSTDSGTSIDPKYKCLTTESNAANNSGTIVYNAISITNPITWNVRKLKLLVAEGGHANASLSYKIRYTVGVTEYELDPTITNGASDWIDSLTGVTDNDPIVSIQLEITLTNGPGIDQQPRLFQFAVLMKD